MKTIESNIIKLNNQKERLEKELNKVEIEISNIQKRISEKEKKQNIGKYFCFQNFLGGKTQIYEAVISYDKQTKRHTTFRIDKQQKSIDICNPHSSFTTYSKENQIEKREFDKEFIRLFSFYKDKLKIFEEIKDEIEKLRVDKK